MKFDIWARRGQRSALLTTLALGALATGALALGTLSPALSADRMALWKIVHDRCVPHVKDAKDPAPCVQLDLTAGEGRSVAILKDLVGVAQHLAIPTQLITGIEGPELLTPDAPDLFGAAWDARSFMFAKLGRELPRDAVSLAINSSIARSQDQAHVHIDCLRVDIRAKLKALALTLEPGWSPKPLDLDGNLYRVLRVDGADLKGKNPFLLVKQGVPEAKDYMPRATIVAVGATFAGNAPGFLILASFADLSAGNLAHGEDVQDHTCAIAKEPA